MQVFKDCQDSSVTLSRCTIHLQELMKARRPAEARSGLVGGLALRTSMLGLCSVHVTSSAFNIRPSGRRLPQIPIVLDSIVRAGLLFLIHYTSRCLQTSPQVYCETGIYDGLDFRGGID